MRLLIESLIVVALIYVGWNTPFHQYADQAHTKISSTLDSLGSSIQKHEDKSVKRY
jgi:shikimate 5-dehydrogenase